MITWSSSYPDTNTALMRHKRWLAEFQQSVVMKRENQLLQTLLDDEKKANVKKHANATRTIIRNGGDAFSQTPTKTKQSERYADQVQDEHQPEQELSPEKGQPDTHHPIRDDAIRRSLPVQQVLAI